MTEPRSYTELRADLMRLADEENKMRLALVDVQSAKSLTIAALVEAADRLMMKSFAEHDAHGEYRPETNVGEVAAFMKPGRKCSNCEDLGHTIRTCTNPRKTKGEYHPVGTGKMMQAVVPQNWPAPAVMKQKRKVKPLSEERKQKLREQLKKARAVKNHPLNQRGARKPD